MNWDVRLTLRAVFVHSADVSLNTALVSYWPCIFPSWSGWYIFALGRSVAVGRTGLPVVNWWLDLHLPLPTC